MKTKRTKRIFYISVITCVVACLAAVIMYRHESSSRRQRIAAVAGLKQIGLALRMDKNDFNGRFSITGSVMTPNIPKQEP
jgi:hypothetical protein